MELIRLTEKNVKETAQKAADALRKGGIIIYPTDTIYGMGVDPFNASAVARLKELKGREKKKPISVIVPDVAHIRGCAEMNAAAEAFAEKHLPGPLTLVMKAKKMPADIMLNGNIGIRIPNDSFCLALAKEYGKPFTTTSANRSGFGTPDTVDEILRHFGKSLHEIALIVDGGPRPSALASTVVTCVEETPHVLREGVISRSELGL